MLLGLGEFTVFGKPLSQLQPGHVIPVTARGDRPAQQRRRVGRVPVEHEQRVEIRPPWIAWRKLLGLV